MAAPWTLQPSAVHAAGDNFRSPLGHTIGYNKLDFQPTYFQDHTEDCIAACQSNRSRLPIMTHIYIVDIVNRMHASHAFDLKESFTLPAHSFVLTYLRLPSRNQSNEDPKQSTM
jgi:hypothetical protein